MSNRFELQILSDDIGGVKKNIEEVLMMRRKQGLLMAAIGLAILIVTAIGFFVGWEFVNPVWIVFGVVFLGGGFSLLKK